MHLRTFTGVFYHNIAAPIKACPKGDGTMLTGYAPKVDPGYGIGKGDPMCGDVGPTDRVAGLSM